MFGNKNNKGFTLIELIITIAILSILLSGVAVTFPQWLRQYIRIEQTAQAQKIMDQLLWGISGEFKYSKSREYSEEGITYICDKRECTFPLDKENCTVSFDAGNKEVVVEGNPKLYGYIFDKDFYNGLTAKVTVSESTDEDGFTYLTSDVEIYDGDGNKLVSAKKQIRCFNN